jgi:hypothetical protein
LLLVLTIPVATIVLGMLLNAVGIDQMVRPPVTAEHSPPAWQFVTGGLFVLLALASFFRQGPRGFLRQLGVGSEDGHHHHHDDDACECHDHDEPNEALAQSTSAS